jgi:hypothetical protein
MPADTTKWPSDVRPISLDGLDHLGVDSRQRLYWDGKRVKTGLDLTWFQTLLAVVVAASTLLGAFATCVQAWTAYHDWACKVRWPVAAKCAESGAGK